VRERQSDEVVRRAREAAVAPSPFVVAVYVIALADAAADRASAAATLARLVPATIWAATADGRRVIEAAPKRPLAEVTREPAVARAVEGQRAKLATLIRMVLGDGGDPAAAFTRYAGWLAGDVPAERPQVVIAHDRLGEYPPTRRERDPVLGAAVAAHVERHAGAIAQVYGDRDARWVHLDVLVAPRAGELVVVTSGMAERPLYPVSRTAERTAGVFTELVMRLPADWRHDEAALGEPRWFWPFGWLRYLGRMPHRHAVAYRARETSGPMSRPDAPRAMAFDGVLFLASAAVPAMAMVGRTVEFLAVCPLHPEELALARERGTDALLGRLRDAGIDPEVVDPERASVV
jgi:hypothetical protein